jgi:hypothetical protein
MVTMRTIPENPKLKHHTPTWGGLQWDLVGSLCVRRRVSLAGTDVEFRHD